MRASMVRYQRAHSPERWTAVHTRLAQAHAAWRTRVEEDLTAPWPWGKAHWRRHHMDETYHRLCARPTAGLPAALEQAVHAAGHSESALRQWTDLLERAARDTADTGLHTWAERLRAAVTGAEPPLTALTALLTRGGLDTTSRAWAHAHRGWCHVMAERYEGAEADLDRAVALDPRDSPARLFRGQLYDRMGLLDQAVADFDSVLEINPAYAWALLSRGRACRQAGRYDRAVADFTAALEINPGYAWAQARRGTAHRRAGRYRQAREDVEQALRAEPDNLTHLFDRVLLDTLESGFAASRQRWAELLTSPVAHPGDETGSTTLLTLFRVLLLRPERPVDEAAEEFLSAGPTPEARTDLLHCLRELSDSADEPATRARRCHEIIAGHPPTLGSAPG
ncbi:tetratricopeptide repeat protein [Streptomyces sp. NPDC057638]|uniref:tetratricopeptide repeat protein n=1 Tax=Streptomyces sp. NPDC057638 TaxID=3346190 RepID=UPI003693B5D1